MKKLTILFLAILVSSGLYAQLPNFGIKVAATASTLNTADLNANLDSENHLGYSLGAFVRLNSGKMYLQPELNYNNRSTEIKLATNNTDLFEIGTIDVPLLVGLKVVDGKVFNLRVFVGPEASFALAKKVDGESYTLDHINDLTWYMQAGIGVDVLFLTFDLRYEKGLSSFIEDYNSDGSFKNNVWVFSLGLKFM